MIATRWDRLMRLALLVGAPLWMAGCSGPKPYSTVPAKGMVTYKGQPLPKGQIQLLPESGPAAATGVIENGAFVLGTNQDGDGAPPGKYRVTVFSFKENKTRFGETITKAVIPDRYSNPDTSGLVVEIPEGGKEDIKVDLTN